MNSSIAEQAPNLAALMDVLIKVSVGLGSCQMTMQDVLRLNVGSIVQLDKKADEPVDLYINQKLVARGEVVVIDERFGIKITEIVSG